MPSTCVIGMIWGDEAKARVVDICSENADIVVRYQGGSNAGHTVVVGSEKFIFHLVPSGILRPGKQCVIANGVVVDPELLIQEVEQLEARGVAVYEQLVVSDRAHMVMPYHKVLDAASEQALGSSKVGTTLRGIGPCYRDKAGRVGIRAADLINPDTLARLLKANLAAVNELLTKIYGLEPLEFEPMFEKYRALGQEMKPLVKDTIRLLLDALRSGKNVLFEGAQGSLLDIDFGTYPYLTSSNTTVGGVCTGTGVPPKMIGTVLGVLKAYATRVGEGAFPTEVKGVEGDAIRTRGEEFGATTGRPRRCGWLDGVAARYAAAINGVDKLAITKLDVLSGQKTLKVCTSYECNGDRFETVPSDYSVLERCRPVYDEMPGWQEDLSGVRRISDLPRAARSYLDYVVRLVDVPVELVSVGSERSQVVYP
ncbi:MAG TPA: adenylosuccinate synthase [Planctomycetota bacterium]|nr:adenylosuccinate synthase [Planctomycetota bacterium]